jgi:hypothetical protein
MGLFLVENSVRKDLRIKDVHFFPDAGEGVDKFPVRRVGPVGSIH